MSIRYYEINDVPAVWDPEARAVPKVYENGAWRPFYGVPRFAHDAYPISFKRFNELMAYEMQATQQKAPPERG